MKKFKSLQIIIALILFSSMEVALKIAGTTFNPIQLNFWRFFIGGICLAPFAFKERSKIRLKRVLSLALTTGFICVVLSMGFYQIAIENAKAYIIAILLSINPIFSIMIQYLLFKVKIPKSGVITSFITIIGTLIIILPVNSNSIKGILYGIVSSVLFGLYSVLANKYALSVNISGIAFTSFTFVCGALELAFLILISHFSVINRLLLDQPVFYKIPFLYNINLKSLPILIYTGVFVTGIALSLFMKVLQDFGVESAALIFYLKPVVSPLIAFLILNETITRNSLYGILVILLGTLITLYNEHRISKLYLH
ncbi:DMT family transporter [Latilactobacillus fragifolii]|uniref:DMT family transporter n=1 Tax=Latilactobacillus fragifolii TaxID=2814244 RepID=UPI001ABA8405|nr:DMT family transporter [Latilactobacillus fragifolii]